MTGDSLTITQSTSLATSTPKKIDGLITSFIQTTSTKTRSTSKETDTTNAPTPKNTHDPTSLPIRSTVYTTSTSKPKDWSTTDPETMATSTMKDADIHTTPTISSGTSTAKDTNVVTTQPTNQATTPTTKNTDAPITTPNGESKFSYSTIMTFLI